MRKAFLFLPLFLLLAACTAAPSSDARDLEPRATSTPTPVTAYLPLVGRGDGDVYYVRPDGGSPEQCTGRADAPYPGSGTGRDCAWDHPFRALPPGGTPRIAGGDTLIIKAGEYRMGYGAPGADNCDSSYPWDCHMPPLPSGPDPAHPTRILGEGWDSGCADPPQLWGAERSLFIVNLTDVSNVQIACLEITDHSGCIEDYSDSSLHCERDNYPFGDWAPVGLYAEDSSNVLLKDLNIHGLAHAGIMAGRLSEWTLENVRLAANGWVGWDGDIGVDNANSGHLTFRHWTVEWNGCGESYPDGAINGCWAQTAGGYGDGVGTGATGGDWLIEDSIFRYNTSDGLDLLYVRQRPSSIVIRRTIAVGNAGNQIKVNGPTTIENSVIVGNCAYFDGQSFTYNVDNCRAAGNALALNLTAGDVATVTNNTLTGEGDCLVEVICEGTCTGAESVRLRNNLFLGQDDFTAQGTERTCWIYRAGFPSDPLDADYSLIYDVKNDPCPVGGHDVCQSPGLSDEGVDTFYGQLLATSPAIDAGDAAACPADDYLGHARPVDGDGDTVAACDIGAYERVP